MTRGLVLALAFIAAALNAGTAFGVGTRWDTPQMAEIQAYIAAEDYQSAIDSLRQRLVVDPNDVEALSLLGFSLRKTGQYSRAEGFYLRALALDPDHLGALEYLGELYVETGRPDAARHNLSRLGQLCGTTCEEYSELAAALEAAR